MSTLSPKKFEEKKFIEELQTLAADQRLKEIAMVNSDLRETEESDAEVKRVIDEYVDAFNSMVNFVIVKINEQESLSNKLRVLESARKNLEKFYPPEKADVERIIRVILEKILIKLWEEKG